jgi:hypothetical protein
VELQLPGLLKQNEMLTCGRRDAADKNEKKAKAEAKLNLPVSKTF